LTAEENFIGGYLFGAGLGDGVEDWQQSGGPLGGGVGCPAQLGHTGGSRAEQREEQPSANGQTDAFGLGGGGDTGEAVGIEHDGPFELLTQRFVFGVEAVVLLGELLELMAVGRTIDDLKDAEGIAVERLAGCTGAVGLPADGAVGSFEDGRGVGDAELGR